MLFRFLKKPPTLILLSGFFESGLPEENLHGLRSESESKKSSCLISVDIL